MFNVQCSMFNVQRSMFNVQCSMFNVQCSMFNVQCSTFNVQCSMFNVQCLNRPWLQLPSLCPHPLGFPASVVPALRREALSYHLDIGHSRHRHPLCQSSDGGLYLPDCRRTATAAQGHRSRVPSYEGVRYHRSRPHAIRRPALSSQRLAPTLY